MMPASRCSVCSKVQESTAIAGCVSVQGLLLTLAMHAALAVDTDGHERCGWRWDRTGLQPADTLASNSTAQASELDALLYETLLARQ